MKIPLPHIKPLFPYRLGLYDKPATEEVSHCLGEVLLFGELVKGFGDSGLALGEVQFQELWELLEGDIETLLLLLVFALVVFEFELLVGVEKGSW